MQYTKELKDMVCIAKCPKRSLVSSAEKDKKPSAPMAHDWARLRRTGRRRIPTEAVLNEGLLFLHIKELCCIDHFDVILSIAKDLLAQMQFQQK